MGERPSWRLLSSLKPVVRWWLAATAFPPLSWAYRSVYWLLIHLAAKRLASFRGTRAVYLMRGWAGEEAVPGVSDIDFTVIGDWESDERERLMEWYARLARRIPLYDPILGAHTVEDFRKRYESTYHFQFRFTEGAASWKLLYGTDYVRQLEPLPWERALGGLHTEVKVWWMFFVRRAITAHGLRTDRVLNHSLCFKVVAEILRMELTLTGQGLLHSRKQVLEAAQQSLSSEANGLFGKLLRCAEGRYLRYDGAAFEEVHAFLLPHLEDLHRRLESHPGLEAGKAVAVKLDGPATEQFRSGAEESLVRDAVGFVQRQWNGCYRAAHAVCGLGFAMDEILLLIEAAPDKLPSLEQLLALSRFHQERSAPLRRRVNLYLLLPAAAYQIHDPAWDKPYQGVLLPQWNPEVFLGLAQPGACVDGEATRGTERAAWTRPVEDFLAEEYDLFREALEDPVIYKTNNLDFLRAFWKCLQLEAVVRSARAGQAVFPMTLPAVRRALAARGVPAAPFLEQFEEGYRSELEGRAADIGRLIPAAVSYLREVTHDG